MHLWCYADYYTSKELRHFGENHENVAFINFYETEYEIKYGVKADFQSPRPATLLEPLNHIWCLFDKNTLVPLGGFNRFMPDGNRGINR